VSVLVLSQASAMISKKLVQAACKSAFPGPGTHAGSTLTLAQFLALCQETGQVVPKLCRTDRATQIFRASNMLGVRREDESSEQVGARCLSSASLRAYCSHTHSGRLRAALSLATATSLTSVWAHVRSRWAATAKPAFGGGRRGELAASQVA
jgi:hypothetical protein